ncbi:MAG: pyridoxal-phosphate dependent enzyme [Pseudomonadota bacterium]
MIDIEYDLGRAQLADSSNPYIRFADLLPVHNPALLPAHMEYTPLVHAEQLGELVGLEHLYLKNETVLPTRSTKDRMAAIALPYLREHGVRAFVTSSTGNSSTAFAQALDRFPGIAMCLVTSSRFTDRVKARSSERLRNIVLEDASFVEASDFCSKLARTDGYTTEAGFFNPARREGLKLAWLETADQAPVPITWYVQAVSSAMGVYGVYKGGKELTAMGKTKAPPRLLCVQQSSCAPMVRAWQAGSDSIADELVVSNPSGIAMAILRGNPSRSYPYIRRIVQESNGHMECVSETEIREATEMVQRLEGIQVCFSSGAAVAGLIKAVDAGDVPRNEAVVVNLTGAERDDNGIAGPVEWLTRNANGWEPLEGVSTAHDNG